MLNHAGPFLDYICPHHYGCHQLQAMEEEVEKCRRMIAKHAPGRDIRLGITEWNTTGGDWGLGRAILLTLDNALSCSRYHNFMHRHCDTIEIANRSNLADSFCSGIIQTNNRSLFKTPTYYASNSMPPMRVQPLLKIEADVDLPLIQRWMPAPPCQRRAGPSPFLPSMQRLSHRNEPLTCRPWAP